MSDARFVAWFRHRYQPGPSGFTTATSIAAVHRRIWWQRFVAAAGGLGVLLAVGSMGFLGPASTPASPLPVAVQSPPPMRHVVSTTSAPQPRTEPARQPAALAPRPVADPPPQVAPATEVVSHPSPPPARPPKRLVRPEPREATVLAMVFTDSVLPVAHADALRRSIGRQVGSLEGCRTDPSLQGPVRLGWSVQGGRSRGVRVLRNDTGSKRAAACVARVVKGWTFSGPVSGALEVPFVFVAEVDR